MTGNLQRGSVVLRGDRAGIVWEVRGDLLIVHPVTKPSRRQRVHDVALSFAELIGANIAMPEAVVRCGQPIELAADGQDHVGELGGAALCRLVAATIRAYGDAQAADKWAGERRHRLEARSAPCVRLVG